MTPLLIPQHAMATTDPPPHLMHACFHPTDPQVKVVGVASGIQQAREMILVDLDAKSTRVTLKIEVAYSEHSHVIGKEGVNIKKGSN